MDLNTQGGMAIDELSETQRRLKDEFVSRRGHWPDAYEQLLRFDPEFFERYVHLSTHPERRGVLDPKVREFIHIVINCTPAIHVSESEIRRHIGNAFNHGATFEELLEILEILSTVGIHSVIKGIPTLTERIDGRQTDCEGAVAEKERVKDHFIDKRGFWDEDLWASILEQDHEFLEHYANFSAHPWEEGVLDPKVKELIYIAMDVGTPHFFVVGLGPHVENALDHGATPREILEVFEIHVEYGLHSVKHGMPILVDEATKRGRLPGNE